ncbi:MAG: hypothetical protein ACJAT1_000195 [Marivirga sp.]|jgi:hypothetical protein
MASLYASFFFLHVKRRWKNLWRQQHFLRLPYNLEWIATPEINWGSIDDTVTIIGMGNEEHISFRIKLVDEGVYELNGKQALYFTTLGLDAVTSEYILKSNQQSSVTITDYDKNRQIISGRFNIYLQKEWPNTADTLEVLNFTNGEFKGEITYFE